MKPIFLNQYFTYFHVVYPTTTSYVMFIPGLKVAIVSK